MSAGYRLPVSGSTLSVVVDTGERVRTRPTVRAVAVFVGAVVVGGVAGFGLTELAGVGELRWANTQLADLATAVGALGAGLLAGRALLGDGPAFLVRVPDGPDPGQYHIHNRRCRRRV